MASTQHQEDTSMYKGVLFGEPLSGPSTVPRVEDWTAQPGDFIIAGFPKSGKTIIAIL